LEFEYVKQMVSMDTDTLDAIMEHYGRDIWNYAYFLTGQHALADDIAQEVFIKAYYGIHTFRGQSSLKTWLLTITRHTAFRHKRSFFLRRVTLLERIQPGGHSLSAETEFLDRQYTDDIWEIIMELPVKFREVLVLDLHYDMPIQQIAELLGIAAGTVKSRLHRARQKVQIKLGEHHL